MANSVDVVAGNDAKASEYNNLRKDVLDLSTGHDHDGTNSSKLNVAVEFKSAITRYLAISPADFIPETNASLWSINSSRIQPGSNIAQLLVYAGVHLPHGATITSFKVFWLQSGHANQGSCYLYRVTPTDGTNDAMANAYSGATTTGHFTVEDTTINYPTINSLYNYCIICSLDAVDDATEINFCGALITYTVATPLP